MTERQLDPRGEWMFRAIGDVGSDLIDSAEHRRFAAGIWRRLAPLAACLVLLVGLGLLAAPLLQTPPQETAPATPLPAEPSTPVLEEQESVVQEYDDAVAVPKERLVVLDTVYYVEAHYTDAEAAPYLGEALGTVSQADRPEAEGEMAYAKKDCGVLVRDGVELPLELFVVQEQGYLYCLTYYAQTGPLFSEEMRQTGWQFLTPLLSLEIPLFDRAEDLSSEELLQMFLLSLELERLAGRRTEDLDCYLWQKKNAYVVPVEDLCRQLDRYLEGYVFDPEQCGAYDAGLQALVLEDLQPKEVQGVLRLLQVEDLGETLQVQVGRYPTRDSDTLVELRRYEIAWTQSGCVFRSIVELTQ